MLRKNINAFVALKDFDASLTGLGSLITTAITGEIFVINVNLQQNTAAGKREITVESSSGNWQHESVVKCSDESQE